MQNIYSSRVISSACSRDINFIWFLNKEKTLISHRLLAVEVKYLLYVQRSFFSDGIKTIRKNMNYDSEVTYLERESCEVKSNRTRSKNNRKFQVYWFQGIKKTAAII